MRRAILLFNPAAGTRRARRLQTIAAVAAALRSRGLHVDAIPTEAPGTAGRQAAALAASGMIDVLFACGGDGTIHEILQGLVVDPNSGTHPKLPALGVLPLGTANALARNLRLPLDPVAAALRQLSCIPRTLPVGKLEYLGPTGPATRYFLVMAGAGPHAALVYSMLADAPFLGKQTLGRLAYSLRSLRLFLAECLPPYTHPRFPAFTVEIPGPSVLYRTEAVSAIAVRVASLGGLFHPLAPGGSIESPTLRLILVRPPSHLALPLWFGLSWLGLTHRNRFVQTFDVPSFRCLPRDQPTLSQSPAIQADGEWLGTAPVQITLVPNALTLLMPP